MSDTQEPRVYTILDSVFDNTQDTAVATATPNTDQPSSQMEINQMPDMRRIQSPVLTSALDIQAPSNRNPFSAQAGYFDSLPFGQAPFYTPATSQPATANMVRFAEDPTETTKADARSSEGRSNADQACDQCRVAKKRCGGRQPACETCENQGISCSYINTPRKRGPVTGYNGGMQKLLGLAIKAGLGGELKRLWDEAMDTPERKSEFVRVWKKDTKENDLENEWRGSEMHEVLRGFLEEVNDGYAAAPPKKAKRSRNTSLPRIPDFHQANLAPPVPDNYGPLNPISHIPRLPDLSEYRDQVDMPSLVHYRP